MAVTWLRHKKRGALEAWDPTDPTGAQKIADGLNTGHGGPAAWEDVTPSAQVFEVENLVIPAGTDWSAVPHAIGAGFEWPDDGSGLVFHFAVELLAAPAPADSLVIEIDAPNDASLGGAFRTFSDTAPLKQSVGGVTGAPPLASSLGDAALAGGLLVPRIWTGAATTAGITVVRARAAFLVI